jgi:hypothetical protein
MSAIEVLMEGIVFGESPRWHGGKSGSLTGREPGDRSGRGSPVQHADLSGVSHQPWNDTVADDRGNAYVNSTGFDFSGGEFAPGIVALVTPNRKDR